MVLAPEHPIIEELKDIITNMDQIREYQEYAKSKSAFERTEVNKDKTGVKIEGLTVKNPVSGREVAVFISDYVMMGYGTGAIMAVPAHDQRDYEFAKKYDLEIIPVIKGGDIEKEAYTGDGEVINSDFLNGYTNKHDSIEKMLEYLDNNEVLVRYPNGVKAVTPGQACVLYLGEQCLGSGIIKKVMKNDKELWYL